MSIVATLTPTNIPSTAVPGVAPMKLYHVRVTTAGGAGTYNFPHLLSYIPTFLMCINNAAEGVNPSTSNLAQVAFCSADTDATNAAFNTAGNGVYDLIYG